MSRTNRFAIDPNNTVTETTHERDARKKRREYRKGEPRQPRFSLGRLRQEIKAIEAWDVVR